MNKLRKVTCKLLELNETATWEEMHTRYIRASRRVILVIIILFFLALIVCIPLAELLGYCTGTAEVDLGPMFTDRNIIYAVFGFGILFSISLSGAGILTMIFYVLEFFERRKNKKDGTPL